VVQPLRDPGTSEQPLIHDAADELIRIFVALRGTAFRIADTWLKI
jgi:hypothetical protein